MNLEDFLVEEQYAEFLKYTNSELKKHARDEMVLDLVPDRFSLEMAKEFLEVSQISIDELRALLHTHLQPAAVYVAKKMEKYQTAQTDAAADEMVKYEPASRVMPIGHLIEFMLIKNNGNLQSYLHDIAMPGAKNMKKKFAGYTRMRCQFHDFNDFVL